MKIWDLAIPFYTDSILIEAQIPESSNGYWVMPGGEFLPVDMGYIHFSAALQWARENDPVLFQKLRSIMTSSRGGHDLVIAALINRGWIRVHGTDQRAQLSIELSSDVASRRAIRRLSQLIRIARADHFVIDLWKNRRRSPIQRVSGKPEMLRLINRAVSRENLQYQRA